MKQATAIIPARGGSKGVPRKNVWQLNGKPLICWSIEAAQAAELVGPIVVSTDDAEIAEVSRAAGAEVVMRPAAISGDAADHLRDWALGSDGRIVSMGVYTEGAEYGTPTGLYYSLPVRCEAGGSYKVVTGLPVDDFSRSMMDATGRELAEELELAKSLLK